MTRSQQAASILSKYSNEVQIFFKESFRFEIKAKISLNNLHIEKELERAWAIWQDHPYTVYADYYNLLEELSLFF